MLLSKTDNSDLMTFKPGDCAGQGRCLSASSCAFKPRLNTSSCVYWQTHLEKLHHCQETTYGPQDALGYLNIHMVTDMIRPFKDQQNTNILMPKSSQIRLHVSQLEPGIQDQRLPWTFSKHTQSQMLGTTWTIHSTILRACNHQTPRFYDHHTTFFASQCCFQ